MPPQTAPRSAPPSRPMPPPLPATLRILATWAAILPLALGARALLGPFVAAWPEPLALALAITLVVPVAVLWAVPFLLRGIAALRARTSAKRAPRGVA